MAGELRFEAVEKAFGGNRALKGVSFSVARGTITALLGENGAGKSTLIKILGGIYKADAGRVSIDDQAYQHRASRKGLRQAVSFIHQDLGLIEWMTITENVALARGYALRGGFGAIDWRENERAAARALALVGCDIHPDTRLQNLSRTEKSLVAIARALVSDCDFLVLDEPTASLPADEVERLFDALRRLRESGVGMIYVSHRLDEIFRVADRVVVMRDGLVVGEKRVEETAPDDLVQLIVGRSTFAAFDKGLPVRGPVRVEVRRVSTAEAGPVDFTVHQGELLGLVGLRGAGQEAIGRALFGAVRATGSVVIDGLPLDFSSPRAALNGGVGLVARERVDESVAPALSIRENTFLNPGASGRRLFSILSPGAEAQRAAALGRTVDLRPNLPDLAIESLSGGNQQKVVVGRWLNTGRKLLVAEDPTAGVDIGAKAEIYGLIAAAIGRGLAVVVVSTDFEEVAHICHRALVFNRGRIIAELDGAALTTERLISTASASEAA